MGFVVFAEEATVTTIDKKLVAKGQQVSLVGLLDQGRYHLELESRYRGALRAAGWCEEHTIELAELVTVLESQRAEAVEARAESKGNTRREHLAVDSAKAFKEKLVQAFTDLHLDRRVEPDDFTVVKKSGELRRSTPRISAYLANIRPQVEKYEPLLLPFFDGVSPLEILDRVKGELDAAQAVQETTLSSLPLETLKVYEAKGRLLTLIEKMNRRAKIAFAREPHILKLFNKDLIRRATGKRAKSVVEAAGEVEGEKTA